MTCLWSDLGALSLGAGSSQNLENLGEENTTVRLLFLCSSTVELTLTTIDIRRRHENWSLSWYERRNLHRKPVIKVISLYQQSARCTRSKFSITSEISECSSEFQLHPNALSTEARKHVPFSLFCAVIHTDHSQEAKTAPRKPSSPSAASKDTITLSFPKEALVR